MKKYLPSKQFLKFFGITIGVGVVVFLALWIFGDKRRIDQNIQSIATRKIIEEQDTDNDGVKDWEEALWGLDLNNPDTDGDGVLDGQEIEKRKSEIRSSDDFVEISGEPKTETDRLARQIATIAFNLNQTSGGNISPQQIEEIAAGFIEGLQPEMFVQYTMSDLKISQTKSAQSYYDEMTEATGHLSEIHGTELVVVERAVMLKREDVLKELEPMIVAYSEAPKKVLKKEIPAEIARAHLNYLNALTQKAIALFAITKYFEDPVVAARGMNEFVVADENLTNASVEITNYLQKSGIIR